MTPIRSWLISYCLFLPSLIVAQAGNEATEPSVEGTHSISLIEPDTLAGWKVPSNC